MSIAENLSEFKNKIGPECHLVAVSKYSDVAAIQSAYDAGQRIFGENKVQDITAKQSELPADIEWHFIGHLQRNKVKFIAPFVSLIQACDSLRLLNEINKQGRNNDRVISCLMQLRIAKEESKFGLEHTALVEILKSDAFREMKHVRVVGLMAMATNTSDEAVVKAEFEIAKAAFDEIAGMDLSDQVAMEILSMGMSQDYQLAIAAGANMIRVGSAIFKN